MLPSFRGLRKFFDGPELWDAGIYSRQDAKNAKLKEFFLGGGEFIEPRLCARQSETDPCAKRTPYENLRVLRPVKRFASSGLRAFVVNPTFLILVAALPRCALRGE
jgi:hypothetical protein